MEGHVKTWPLVFLERRIMDTLLNIYIIVSLIVIIFQYWYIHRLKRTINFAVECLNKFAVAMASDNPAHEVERVTNDIKNFK